jgi:hypothetical protein
MMRKASSFQNVKLFPTPSKRDPKRREKNRSHTYIIKYEKDVDRSIIDVFSIVLQDLSTKTHSTLVRNVFLSLLELRQASPLPSKDMISSIIHVRKNHP